ncbi:MAG TPA: YihY/virulence factor BrkB family protein [Acidisoma sp.]|uniref:YihY/virulence factor BrkB family protein n=1 Tax=Acidisoma sp. TaxID=1872115 RepID=UPI002BF8DC32|nr:YihY/virulence factor BrkB family protein [Acidisoma sp.]HTI01636.1 YihY/virulence factor BrkB family protein [Acidisoma sp.]
MPVMDKITNFEAVQMVKDTLNGFMEDNCLSRGAAIAYFTIFSLAPILLVVIAIAGFAFGEDAARGVVFTKLQGMVGRDAAGLVQSMIQSAANRKSGIIATVISIVMLLVTASGVFGELQSSLNSIWKTDAKEVHSTVSRLIRARAQSLGLVVTLGFLLLVSLAISAAISAAWDQVNQAVPGASFVLRLINILLSLCFTTLLFAAVYKVLPDRQLKWRDVLMGSFFTAVLYTIGKAAIAAYIGRSGVASSYGAAGALVVLLLWVYYSAQIFLLGAEFTKVYATRRGSQKHLLRPFGFSFGKNHGGESKPERNLSRH